MQKSISRTYSDVNGHKEAHVENKQEGKHVSISLCNELTQNIN